MSLKIEFYNQSYIKIEGDEEDKNLLNIYFRKPVKNYWHIPLYKSGQWDGHIKFFNLSTGLLPIGLYTELFTYLDSKNIDYTIDDILIHNISPIEIDSSYKDIFLKDINPSYLTQLRDYQIEGAKLALTHKKGILEHATGSGKTLTCYYLLKYLLSHLPKDKKILYIVPNISLIHQGFADLKEYGLDTDNLVGKYYAKEKDLNKTIIIGTWQSFCQLSSSDFINIYIIINDETHKASAKEISKVLTNCVNAEYKIGVTGSMPSDSTDRLSIIGALGPVLQTVRTKELQKREILSDIEVKVIDIFYPREVKRTIHEWPDEIKFIQDYEPRKKITNNIIKHYCKNSNTLILFDRLELGKKYMEYLKPFYPDKIFYWIEGKIDGEDREDIRLKVNEEDNILLFGTLGTMSTGINIPKLHNIIFLSMGKSDIRLRQSIGRGLRKHDSKEKLTIFDIADELKFGRRHLLERLNIYNTEQFPVQILEVNL